MRRGLRLSVLVGLAAVLISAAVAAALQLETRSKEFQVSSDTPKVKTVGCERRDDIVSGGFFGKLDGSRVIARVFKLTGSERVRLRANNISSPSTGSASVHAYCADRFPELVKRSRSVMIAPGNEAVDIRCPGDTEPVWGGFRMSDGGPLPSLSKRVGDDRWRVAFTAEGPDTVTGFAYCADLNRNVVAARKTEALPGGATGAVRARCPRGTDIMSGGYRGESSFSPPRITIVGGSMLGGGRWQAYGQAATMRDSKLTAYAYCLSERR